MEKQQQENLAVSPISLPKGGGSIRGMEAALGAVGPNGAASMSLPLPISPGRGYAPQLAVQYQSGAGNGVFGVGWQLSLPRIARQTSKGAPAFDDSDEFIGPDGEVMVPERDAQGGIVCASRNRHGGIALGQDYEVTRYFPRVEGSFDRIEYWRAAQESFWLVHSADGQLHAFGKTAQARVANGAQVAEWLLEESVSPTGEHIEYVYRAEDGAGVDVSGHEASRQRGALRHLVEVCYGNRTPAQSLYVFQNDPGKAWLFHLVLDYGERGVDTSQAPAYDSAEQWLSREDAFSGYQYGFETRCHRLCRQVLMFHRFQELGNEPYLISRLMLEYDENPVLTQLTAARQWAYEQDGMAVSLPPVEWYYSTFAPQPDPTKWKAWEGLPGMDDGQPWQMVDLYGEGLPGCLHRTDKGWHYREPVRGEPNTDKVGYAPWQAVPLMPTLAGQSQLMDCDGDGRLDWVVTQPGLAGFFTLSPERSVSGFTPFSAVPNEFFHPQAQMADLMGEGLSDLALIGPKSVRLYANLRRQGFAAPIDCAQSDGVTLPVPGADKTALVAFADVLGSGQQHLVEVRHDGVRCWPNLSKGRFGAPLRLARWDLDAAAFDPEQVYLADLDGSGAADLILAQSDTLQVYFNQAGNGFAAPMAVPLPAGCRFDRMSRLNLADVDGRGMSSLILSTPLPDMRHWRYDFCEAKPYLLTGANNNMGAESQIGYRSSAQFWLDDKDAGYAHHSRLPFPIHTVAQVTTRDEISGNTLSQVYRYHHGVYDGQEREFRGFGLVESEDTAQDASATRDGIAFTPPVRTRTWYHTGFAEDDAQLSALVWQGDTQAYQLGATRLTEWRNHAEHALPASVDDVTRWWMMRALKGSVLRQEVFGLDGNEQQAHPYAVSLSRYQVRLVQKGQGPSAPVVLPQSLEQLSYQYERIPSDPQCSQQVQLESNDYGQPTRTVSIQYPRRPQPATSPYPNDLPETSVASSYDTQQQRLRLIEAKQSYHQLTQPDAWLLGIPNATRQDVLDYPATKVPPAGLSFEALMQDDGLLAPSLPRTYAGQEQVFYRQHPPTSLPVLVDHVETAELDNEALKAYDTVLSPEALKQMLETAGYQSHPKLLEPKAETDEAEETVWVAARGYTTYYPKENFYLPLSQQATKLTGEVELCYDRYGFVLSSMDALGNQTTVEKMDYRFLMPIEVRDINDNLSHVKLDALGRVVAGWFAGTENGSAQSVGFTAPSEADCASASIETLLARANGAGPMTVASRQAWNPFSWMAPVTPAALPGNLKSWLDQGWLIQETGTYRLTARGRRVLKSGGASGLDETHQQALLSVPRIPPHAASLKADRYPDPTYYSDGLPQQIHAGIRYGDGFGRDLQALAKDEPGEAYCRRADGELEVENGKPVEEKTNNRWVVSGRVEYDNKGQVVRAYQPYFINDWQYVVDRSLRACGYADEHFYDPLGRERLVETAKGYQRRVRYYPWFRVSEDENDLSPTA
ncbi:SpvB/TcaC N-terminal domain-containing protein [Chromobacterium violaceum]|uniref:SpvB/TcaC N-terminal domain-containing protein n=1 Tax=Chromobacterium violaceum TaxID=536 RepID=UPI001B3335D5|nr:SpvB/TcaC N-terminal domain-containing protein [Chromobacterium violaceum]MBP4044868.1 hypothetical protein [Chromobacterium violaceum]